MLLWFPKRCSRQLWKLFDWLAASPEHHPVIISAHLISALTYTPLVCVSFLGRGVRSFLLLLPRALRGKASRHPAHEPLTTLPAGGQRGSHPHPSAPLPGLPEGRPQQGEPAQIGGSLAQVLAQLPIWQIKVTGQICETPHPTAQHFSTCALRVSSGHLEAGRSRLPVSAILRISS